MGFGSIFSTLQIYLIPAAVKTAQTVAGDISRRKKVKEKRPSPLLFSRKTPKPFLHYWQ